MLFSHDNFNSGETLDQQGVFKSVKTTGAGNRERDHHPVDELQLAKRGYE